MSRLKLVRIVARSVVNFRRWHRLARYVCVLPLSVVRFATAPCGSSNACMLWMGLNTVQLISKRIRASSSIVVTAGVKTPPTSMSLCALLMFKVVPAVIPAAETATSRLHKL